MKILTIHADFIEFEAKKKAFKGAEADVEKVDGPSAGEETAEASSEEGKTWPWVVAILVVVVAGIIYWWKTK